MCFITLLMQIRQHSGIKFKKFVIYLQRIHFIFVQNIQESGTEALFAPHQFIPYMTAPCRPIRCRSGHTLQQEKLPMIRRKPNHGEPCRTNAQSGRSTWPALDRRSGWKPAYPPTGRLHILRSPASNSFTVLPQHKRRRWMVHRIPGLIAGGLEFRAFPAVLCRQGKRDEPHNGKTALRSGGGGPAQLSVRHRLRRNGGRFY